jgi:hypothetical protein
LLPQGEQGKCWNGQQGTNWDFAGGLLRQFGNDMSSLGAKWQSLQNPFNPLNDLNEALAAHTFGSNDTNKGIFGADMAPALELIVPVGRFGYATEVARIGAASAVESVAARNGLKVTYRLGAFRNTGMADYNAMRAAGKSDADIISSARRSNFGVNTAAAALAVSSMMSGCH